MESLSFRDFCEANSFFLGLSDAKRSAWCHDNSLQERNFFRFYREVKDISDIFFTYWYRYLSSVVPWEDFLRYGKYSTSLYLSEQQLKGFFTYDFTETLIGTTTETLEKRLSYISSRYGGVDQEFIYNIISAKTPRDIREQHAILESLKIKDPERFDLLNHLMGFLHKNLTDEQIRYIRSSDYEFAEFVIAEAVEEYKDLNILHMDSVKNLFLMPQNLPPLEGCGVRHTIADYMQGKDLTCCFR
jgi:hypothetical protein